MEWKFRKDFQVMPGIHLKYGKGGIHTQIMPPETDKAFEAEKLKLQLFKPYESVHEIKSAAVDELSSSELQEFKTLLLASNQSFDDTQALLVHKSNVLDQHSGKLGRLQRSLFRFLFKKKIYRMQEELPVLEEEVTELQQQLELSSVNLEIDSEDIFYELYKNVLKAFKLLDGSEKKWDLTSSKANNRVAERTAATSTVTRSEVSISEKHLPILRCDVSALCFHNMNGGDLYLYPGFMIVYESSTDFAVISYADLQVNYSQARFIESEEVPSDTRIVDKTWYKVNKDGSPDKRFSYNYEIPVVEYGYVKITSSSGLNEVYCFSNANLAMLFCKAVSDYIEAIRKSQSLLNEFQR